MLLPAPEGPTIASFSPGLTRNENFRLCRVRHGPQRLTLDALADVLRLAHQVETGVAGHDAGAFRVGIQLSAPFLVFGLVFNAALGVLSRLMPQMQVYFVAVPLSIMIGFLILLIVVGAMMASFLDYVGSVLHELAPYS